MPDGGATSSRSRKRRGRRALLLLVLLLGGLYGGYRYLTHPTRIERIARETVARVLGAETTIGRTQFSASGMITFDDVSLRVPEMPGAAGRLATVKRVAIEFDPAALLGGDFRMVGVSVHNPIVYVCEDAVTGEFNFQRLQQQHADEAAGPRTSELPQVWVEEGRAVFAQTEGGEYSPQGAVRFHGNLTRVPELAGVYAFLLQQKVADQRSGPTLSGRIDLKELSITGRVEHFALYQPQGSVMPRRIRQWWDRAAPGGKLPEVAFTYDAQEGFSANVVARSIWMNIPLGDQGGLALKDASGSFVFTQGLEDDAIRIELKDVRGRLDDPNGTADYEVDGWIGGVDFDAPFDLRLKASGRTEDAPDMLAALPEQVQRYFWLYAPAGQFVVNLHLHRDAYAGPIHYEGDTELEDATLVYEAFPYELREVSARFVFDESQVKVERMKAVGVTGAKIDVRGSVRNPGPNAESDMWITATQAPLDELLFDVLTVNERRAVATFVDDQSWRKLVRRGLIRTERTDVPLAVDQDGADAPPVFELGGKGRLDIYVTRRPDREHRWETQVTLHPDGPVNLMFRYWPYPFTATGGSIHLQRGLVEARDVTIESFTGAKANVSGRFYQDEAHGGRWTPDLTITGSGVPVNELLMSTISSPQDQWLRSMHIDGRFDAEAKVFLSEQGRITYRVNVAMANGTARPNGGDYVLSDVTARAVLEPGGATIESVTASRGQTELHVNGEARWGGSRQAAADDAGGEPDEALPFGALGGSMNLHVRGEKVRFEDPLVHLIPTDDAIRDSLAEVHERFDPRGQFDFELDFRHGAQADYRLTVRPSDIAFNLREKRIELSDMSGRLTVTPRKIEMEKLAASWANGRGTVSGTAELVGEAPALTGDAGALEGFDWGGALRVDVTIDGDVTELDETVRTVLPGGVSAVIDGLELEGGFGVRAARLRFGAAGGEADAGPADFSFSGDLLLRNASANVGVDVTAIDGTVALNATHRDGWMWPRLDATLDLANADVIGRRIESLRATVDNHDHRNELLIRDLAGDCYGGRVMGSAKILLGESMVWSADLVAQEVALEKVIEPGVGAGAAPQVPGPEGPGLEAKGLLSASLMIEGQVGDEASRRGRGELRVIEGRLYRTPLTLAMLHVLNASRPSLNHFDRAAAKYLIDGDLVRFDMVRFDTPSVEVVGNGWLRLSTLDLDLRMVTRNAETKNLGPLVELIDLVKDQLVSIKVDGTLTDPKVKAQSFAGVKASWQKIFGPPGPPELPERDRRESASPESRVTNGGRE